jgi:hypothetical protein
LFNLKFNGARKIAFLCPLHRVQHAFDHGEASVRNRCHRSSFAGQEKECIPMNFRLIGATALSLILAGPAMAASNGHDGYHELYRHHELPAQDAINFGYGNAYPTYHSGWGGLYGDGNYPGTVDDNMGPTYRDR